VVAHLSPVIGGKNRGIFVRHYAGLSSRLAASLRRPLPASLTGRMGSNRSGVLIKVGPGAYFT
jgi:hypothetical protein